MAYTQNSLIQELQGKEAALSANQKNKMAKIMQGNTFKESFVVRIGNIKALENRNAIPVKIPGVKQALVAERSFLEVYSEDEFQWIGTFKKADGEVFINATKEGIFGRIKYEGDTYLLEDIGNGKTLLMKYSEEAFTEGECGTPHEKTSEHKEEKVQPRSCSNKTIRVGVMYTNKAAATGLNMYSIASTGIYDLNRAAYDSGLSTSDIRFDLAAVAPLNMNIETTDPEIDVESLATNSAVNNFRNAHRADIVVVLTNGTEGDEYPTLAGRAYDIGVPAHQAFAIVQAPLANGHYTFGHEIIHVIGGRHNDCAMYIPCDTTTSGIYNFGYNWTESGGFLGLGTYRYTTIMHLPRTYWSFNQLKTYSRRLIISNPSRGQANRYDNARVLRENACRVANFVGNPFTMTVSGSTYIPKFSPVSLYTNVSGCGGSVTYRWETSTDGWNYWLSSTGSNYNTYSTWDKLYVRVTATCSDGQKVTRNLTITAYNSGCVYCLNDNELADTKQLDANVIETKDFVVYPNPASDFVNIALIEDFRSENLQISVTDLLGKTVLTRQLDGRESTTIQLELPNIKTGFYFITIKNNTHEKIAAKKIFIHK